MIRAVLPKVPEIDEYHVDEISIPVYTWPGAHWESSKHYIIGPTQRCGLGYIRLVRNDFCLCLSVYVYALRPSQRFISHVSLG